MIDPRRVRHFRDRESACRFAARIVVQTLGEAGPRGASLALSGGSSPVRLFELLTQAPYAGGIPWSRLSVFWVDERMVPPEHALSNFGLAKKLLLDRAPALSRRIFPMPTQDILPEAAARAYEQTLRNCFRGRALPRFDMVVLGMGPDGHIASLFPGDPALSVQADWVAPVQTPGMEPLVPRLSLTLPVLNGAKRTVVLVLGAGKREAFHDAAGNPESRLPAALLKPRGDILWLTCFC